MAITVKPASSVPDRALSVCQITTKYLTLKEEVRAYKAAGIDGISLWWDKLKVHGAAQGARLLSEAQLPAVSMVGAPPMVGASAAQTREAFDDLRRALDDCAAVGASVLGVVAGNRNGRSLQAMEQATIEVLDRLGEEARQRGVTLALEAIHAPYFDFLNTLRDADRIVRAVDQPSVGLLFDTWHLCHEPELDTRIEETASRIALVHFSDWRQPTRCHDDRLLPGEGVLPLKRMLSRLYSSGYRGYFDIEVFSEDVWQADPMANLRACRAFFDTVWDGLDE
jgi:sugar phosphate isomerase/epimerase